MSISPLRSIIVATAAVALVSALSGCASEGSGNGGGPVSPDTEATITYAIWDETQQPGIEANIASFNKLYPGITVNVTVTPWEDYWTKLQTQASSDTLPDIFWINASHFPVYAGAGKLASAQPLIDDGSVTLSNYPAPLVSAYAFDGVQYGIPKDFDTFAVWYNPALFDDAGVAVPAEGWTWDDFETTAHALREKLKAQGAYGVAAELTGVNSLYSSIWQAGGEILSEDGNESLIDSPETVSAIEMWQGLVSDDSMPSPQQLSDTSALGWFGSGKAAMYVSGSYDRSAIVDSSLGTAVQVAPLPMDVERASVTGGLAPVVNAGSKNLAATRAFQAYLASRDAQEEQGALGTIIPAFIGTQSGWTDTMPDTDLSVFIDAVSYSHTEPVNATSSQWGPSIDEIFVQAVSGQLSAAEAAKQMGEAMTTAMQKSQ